MRLYDWINKKNYNPFLGQLFGKKKYKEREREQKSPKSLQNINKNEWKTKDNLIRWGQQATIESGGWHES